jgi:hypothetical protein
VFHNSNTNNAMETHNSFQQCKPELLTFQSHVLVWWLEGAQLQYADHMEQMSSYDSTDGTYAKELDQDEQAIGSFSFVYSCKEV